MKIEFRIKELGPIKDFTFELKPFMIFSGESSTGKSYASFLIYFLHKALANDDDESFLGSFFKSQNIPHLDDNLVDLNIDNEIEISVSEFLKQLNIQSINFMSYLLKRDELEGDIDIDIKFEFDVFKIRIDSDYVLYEGLDGEKKLMIHTIYINSVKCFYIRKYSISLQNALEIAFSNYFKKTFFDKQFMESFLLPPSRGGFMALNYKGKTELLSGSGMYDELVKNIDSLDKFNFDAYTMPDKLQQLMSDVLGGEVEKSEDKILYITKQGLELPISAVASSIKELAPLFLILQKKKVSECSILFEEPESHLHPELQTRVAELLIYMIQNGGHLQITTHSDYILSRIADAIRQFSLKQKMTSDKYESFCENAGLDAELVLNPDDIGAYCFKKNDREETEIELQNLKDARILTSFTKVVDERLDRSFNIREQFEKLD